MWARPALQCGHHPCRPFLKFSVHADHLRILLNFRLWFIRSDGDLQFCTYNRLPGDNWGSWSTDHTTLWEARTQSQGWQTTAHMLEPNQSIPVFVNKILLEHIHIHLLTYCLWLLSHCNSRVPTTETLKHKILHPALYRKFADPGTEEIKTGPSVVGHTYNPNTWKSWGVRIT